MAALRGLRLMLCVLPLMALAACNGIGKGDKINHLQMVTKGTAITFLPSGSQVLAYQCLRQQLGFYAIFGKNGTADYTERPAAVWTSSDPGVVRVSNGDERDPTDPERFFPKGVITPLQEGTAVITVEYAGLKTSIPVLVGVPESIILSTSPFDTASDASASVFNIATGSTQQYYAYAKLRDNENNLTTYQDVTGNAKWTSPDDPGGHISVTTSVGGLTSGGGLVTGLSPGGPYTVNANFSACPDTQYENIKAQVQVSELSSLTVTHDPNFLILSNPNPPAPLVVNTSEAFVITGLLENGATQDLSYQATLSTETGNAGILAFTQNVATALDDGSTQITARFRSITSPPLVVQTQNAVLSGFAISPGLPPVPGAYDDKNQDISYQGFHSFHAIGTFTPEVPGNPLFVQDMTQSALWTSDSPEDVSIGNAGQVTGVAVSRRSKQTCVVIRGTIDASNFDSTALGVGAPVSNTTCP